MNIHDRAIEILDEGGWTQGEYYGHGGSHCAMGCYRKALVQKLGASNELMVMGLYRSQLRKVYGEFLAALYDRDSVHDMTLNTMESSIGYWNDKIATEPSQVREIFKKASENYDLSEQEA